MDSDSVCNHRSDKQNRTTAKRESDFFCLTCQSLWISGCCYVILVISVIIGLAEWTYYDSLF